MLRGAPGLINEPWGIDHSQLLYYCQARRIAKSNQDFIGEATQLANPDAAI